MFTMKSRLQWRWFRAIGVNPFAASSKEEMRPRRCYLCNRLLKPYSCGDTIYIYQDEKVQPVCRRHADKLGDTVADCLTTEKKLLIHPCGPIAEKALWYWNETTFWLGSVQRFCKGLPLFSLVATLNYIIHWCTIALKWLERNTL